MQDKFDQAMNAITDIQVKLHEKNFYKSDFNPINKNLVEAWLLLFEASALLSELEKEKLNAR